MSFLYNEGTSTSVRLNPSASSQSLLLSSSSTLYEDHIGRQHPPRSSSSTQLSDSSATFRVLSRTHSPKRLSVFQGRSRSNTGNSSSSSFKSPASSMTSIDALSSRRSSQDSRTLSGFFVNEKEGLTKSLFARGSRILRRQGSKASLATYPSFGREDDMTESKSGDGSGLKEKNRSGSGLFHRSHRSRHSDMHDFLKRSISGPFDFQHVTHTSQNQLPPIERTHPQDLATEFSIIRASQRPDSELKGIQADDLFYQNATAEDWAGPSILAPDSQSLYTRSPPQSPRHPEMPTRPLYSRLPSRSVENFSRPVSKAKFSTTPFIQPPPRSSSKSACARPADPTSLTIDALLGHGSPYTPPDQTELPGPPAVLFDEMEPFPDEVFHAVTTDDYVVKIPPRSPVDLMSGLANIPEEKELSWRNSGLAGPAGSLKTGSSLSPQLHLAPADVGASPIDLHSPILPPVDYDFRRVHKSPSQPELKNPPSQPLEDDSWEDDIDFCYEHAAESDSNFDWQRVASEEVENDLARLSLQDDKSLPFHQEDPQRPSHFQQSQQENGMKSTPTTPEPFSMFSFPRPGSSSPTDLGTSFEYFPSPKAKLTGCKFDDFQLGPPLDERFSPLPMYGGQMPDIQESDEEVVYFQPDDSNSSARSSCLPLSKCNSQESMILSRAASIARKHRSSVSTTSVPDLIHSPSDSRETVSRDSSSPMVEQSRTFVSRSSEPSIPVQSTPDMGCNATSCSSKLSSTSLHDRFRSQSATDNMSLTRSLAARKTNSRMGCHRKRGTSYSLFPTPPPPTPK